MALAKVLRAAALVIAQFTAMIAVAAPASDLSTLFQAELLRPESRPLIPLSLKLAVTQTATVFVAGVLGEVLPGYFTYNSQSMKSDFGQDSVQILRPPTCVAEETNAAQLDLSFRALRSSRATNDDRPLLVIGHSKGGAEALLALLRDPSLIRDGVVDRLVLIAGSVGGSAIADLPALHGGALICAGAESLQRDVSHATFQAALTALAPSDLALLSSRVFFVRTSKPTAKVALVFKESGHYLTEHFGANDGMMLPDDEFLEGFGTDLGILLADHSDLIGWGPYTGSPAEYKRAFTRALMRELFSNSL